MPELHDTDSAAMQERLDRFRLSTLLKKSDPAEKDLIGRAADGDAEAKAAALTIAVLQIESTGSVSPAMLFWLGMGLRQVCSAISGQCAPADALLAFGLEVKRGRRKKETNHDIEQATEIANSVRALESISTTSEAVRAVAAATKSGESTIWSACSKLANVRGLGAYLSEDMRLRITEVIRQSPWEWSKELADYFGVTNNR